MNSEIGEGDAPSAGRIQVWKAGGASDRNPTSTWSEGLARAFVRLDCEAVSPDPFFGAIEQVHASDFTVSRVAAGAHRVVRLAEHARNARADIVFVNLQTSATGFTEQAGRTVRTYPFDVAIADTLRPFVIAHADRFSLICLGLPRARVPESALRAGGVFPSRSPVAREVARLLVAEADLALDSRLAPQTRGLFIERVIGLLAVAASLSEPEPVKASRSSKGDLIEAYARRNFRNPTLGAEGVGRAFGVSGRYVQKAMTERGATFSELIDRIRTRRLRARTAPLRRLRLENCVRSRLFRFVVLQPAFQSAVRRNADRLPASHPRPLTNPTDSFAPVLTPFVRIRASLRRTATMRLR